MFQFPYIDIMDVNKLTTPPKTSTLKSFPGEQYVQQQHKLYPPKITRYGDPHMCNLLICETVAKR